MDTQTSRALVRRWATVWQVSQPYASSGSAQNWTTYSDDGLGRTTKVVAADGSSTTSYSYQTNTVTVTDPKGNWKTYTMDVSGNLTGVLELLSATNPENRTVTYVYNSNNTLASKTDFKGSVFTYQYDSYNRVTSISANGSVLRTFYYDANPLNSSFSQYAARGGSDIWRQHRRSPVRRYV